MRPFVHPPFRRLRAYADSAAPTEGRARVTEHLAGCDRCRRTVAEVRSIRAGAAAWREPVPETAWPAIVARLDRAERPARPSFVVADPVLEVGVVLPRGRGLLRAALFVLAAAGLASAAVPGSTLRTWLEELIAGPSVPSAPAPSLPPSPAPAVVEPVEPVAGVILPAARRAVEITVLQAPPELRLRITTVSGDEAVVRAHGGAADAIFRPRGGGVEVVAPGPGELEIELPTTGVRISLYVNGRRYLISEHGDIRLLVPAADTVGGITFRVGR